VSEAEYPEDVQRSEDDGPAAQSDEGVAPAADGTTAEPDQSAGAGPSAGAQPPAAAESATWTEPPAGAGASAETETPGPGPSAEAGSSAGAPPAEDAGAGEPVGAPMDEARADESELEEIELAPRERPEIPGADLVPDILPEGEEFLDAEARAAAEAEAEAAAARAQEEQDDEPRPIADAAIDLAAGARYTATGKRKTAVARVILKPGTGTYSVNGKRLDSYFPRETLQRVIRQPLETVGYESRMDVVARMHGGGVSAQAGALRHGISRALIVADPHLRGELKRRGFLTRDPRVKERKKAGLKKARKRPQFSKR